MARTRTIDKNKLYICRRITKLEQPHGILIGIGCNLGQSSAVRIRSVRYSCRRFMAVTDTAIHREVLDSLRPVVRFFMTSPVVRLRRLHTCNYANPGVNSSSNSGPR